MKLDSWALMRVRTSAAVLPLRRIWLIDQEIWPLKIWILSRMVLMSLQGVLLLSSNQSTTLGLSDYIKKWEYVDHRDAAARSKAFLIAIISMWMAESALTSLLNCNKLFRWWSLKMPQLPLLEDSIKKEPSTLILIDPKEEDTQEILIERYCRKGAETR